MTMGMNMFIDVSFAVQEDMKSHTVGAVIIGHGAVMSNGGAEWDFNSASAESVSSALSHT